MELYLREDKLYLPDYVLSDGPQYRHIPLASGTLTHRTQLMQLLKVLHILQTINHFCNANICHVLQSSFTINTSAMFVLKKIVQSFSGLEEEKKMGSKTYFSHCTKKITFNSHSPCTKNS